MKISPASSSILLCKQALSYPVEAESYCTTVGFTASLPHDNDPDSSHAGWLGGEPLAAVKTAAVVLRQVRIGSPEEASLQLCSPTFQCRHIAPEPGQCSWELRDGVRGKSDASSHLGVHTMLAATQARTFLHYPAPVTATCSEGREGSVLCMCNAGGAAGQQPGQFVCMQSKVHCERAPGPVQ